MGQIFKYSLLEQLVIRRIHKNYIKHKLSFLKAFQRRNHVAVHYRRLVFQMGDFQILPDTLGSPGVMFHQMCIRDSCVVSSSES